MSDPAKEAAAASSSLTTVPEGSAPGDKPGAASHPAAKEANKPSGSGMSNPQRFSLAGKTLVNRNFADDEDEDGSGRESGREGETEGELTAEEREWGVQRRRAKANQPRCFICLEVGHTTTDCQVEQYLPNHPSKEEIQARRRRGVCTECGAAKHDRNSCPVLSSARVKAGLLPLRAVVKRGAAGIRSAAAASTGAIRRTAGGARKFGQGGPPAVAPPGTPKRSRQEVSPGGGMGDAPPSKRASSDEAMTEDETVKTGYSNAVRHRIQVCIVKADGETTIDQEDFLAIQDKLNQEYLEMLGKAGWRPDIESESDTDEWRGWSVFGTDTANYVRTVVEKMELGFKVEPLKVVRERRKPSLTLSAVVKGGAARFTDQALKTCVESCKKTFGIPHRMEFAGTYTTPVTKARVIKVRVDEDALQMLEQRSEPCVIMLGWSGRVRLVKRSTVVKKTQSKPEGALSGIHKPHPLRKEAEGASGSGAGAQGGEGPRKDGNDDDDREVDHELLEKLSLVKDPSQTSKDGGSL